MNNNSAEYKLPIPKLSVNNENLIEFFKHSELFKEFVSRGLFIYTNGTADNIQMSDAIGKYIGHEITNDIIYIKFHLLDTWISKQIEILLQDKNSVNGLYVLPLGIFDNNSTIKFIRGFKICSKMGGI